MLLISLTIPFNTANPCLKLTLEIKIQNIFFLKTPKPLLTSLKHKLIFTQSSPIGQKMSIDITKPTDPTKLRSKIHFYYIKQLSQI